MIEHRLRYDTRTKSKAQEVLGLHTYPLRPLNATKEVHMIMTSVIRCSVSKPEHESSSMILRGKVIAKIVDTKHRYEDHGQLLNHLL